jgi:hypothetical protein
MSLVEDASGTATAAELRDEPAQRVSGTISGLVTGIVATGIATVTLGWIALLVRGAVWLIRG